MNTQLAQVGVPELYDTGMDTSATGAVAGMGIGMLIWLTLLIISLVGLWKTFTKAGKPGWGSLIPVYNTFLMIKIAQKPGWWLALLLIPMVNIIILFIVMIELGKLFGKGVGWSLLFLILLGPIGFLILGLSSAQYQGEIQENKPDLTPTSKTPPNEQPATEPAINSGSTENPSSTESKPAKTSPTSTR